MGASDFPEGDFPRGDLLPLDDSLPLDAPLLLPRSDEWDDARPSGVFSLLPFLPFPFDGDLGLRSSGWFQGQSSPA